MALHTFEVVQNREIVAIVSGNDRERVLREALHYALMFSNEGQCTIAGVTPDDWEAVSKPADVEAAH